MVHENSDHQLCIQTIDVALKEWRQGDFVLGEQWFVYRIDPQQPLAESSKNLDAEGLDLVEDEVQGLVVVTQTCDIVRSCESRPFVEMVPLVAVKEQVLNEIRRGRRPQYAFILGASAYSLVADLDRVMTVEKAVVAGWKCQQGCSSDQEVRLLGKALARKRVRFAFPDDFIERVNELQSRLQNKHPKLSPEGEALRALREIRVRAAPSWSHNEIQLMFWFIREEEEIQFQGVEWYNLLDKWMKLVPEGGRFQSVKGQVLTLEDLTAKDYIESDPLDLDHLSD